MTLFADVILPIAFDSFTYRIPSSLHGSVMRGCRVVVPLGKNKIYTGVVLTTHNNEPIGIDIKDIIEVLDEHPVVNENQFKFWQWISKYYLCPLGDVMKCGLPGAMKPKDAKALKEVKRKQDKQGKSILSKDDLLYNTLNSAQIQALTEIEQSFETKNVTLLHGVTSSGKTEIYIHLIKKYLDEGKQVLYLLPEIALTTQITNRLQRVFGDNMGVYHSKFTEVQRLNVYKRQASSHPYQLILGVRSCIFLPFQNLGLVIVDEEHEQSYKQQEPAPRYHARNAAIMLSHMFGAKTLLGTATPSFEVFHLAHKDKYGYVKLTKRYRDMQMPVIEVVDTREAKRRKQMTGMFSPRLIEAIQHSINKKEQVILFQNRRGYSHFIECKQCGWIPHCPHCDVTLTLHKKTSTLTCHYCGYTCNVPHKCPNCKEEKFTSIGTGTERIEDDIQVLFPNATTLRMDLDTAKTRNQYERIIGEFADRKADILIGTQMVTKGLDFDNVSVVGILDADSMLHIPDFRSYERTFHTLSQVAGRAGRKATSGHVILQTRSADSEIIRQIKNGDYWSMFCCQMEERQLFKYPPFTRLIYVYLRHRDDELLTHLAIEMGGRLRTIFGSRVLGPEKPVISRIQSLYIRKIMIKIEHSANIDKVRQALISVQQQMTQQPVARNLNIFYDVDPM